MDKLRVYYRRRVVGEVAADDAGRFSFTYDEGWLDDADAFAVSLSLPLTREPYAGDAAHSFFANLLPEGRVRTLVARRLGLSEDNDFALLAALGGECAGALVIAETTPAAGRYRYRDLADDEIAELAASGQAFARVSGSGGIRLSLAGAQDKLAVRVHQGKLQLPEGSSPSTHIVKFPSPDFAHLVANEAFVAALARACDLRVVDSELRRMGKQQCLLVTRYDRVVAADGSIVRLHQEDLCQALGLRPTRKYEAEGGPSLARCLDIVRSNSTEPALDSRALIRWFIFNAIVGNADGHAKNLSLLWTAGRTLRLAPFYDLICTSAYGKLERRLAMSVGGRADPGTIRGRDWRQLAADAGLQPRYVTDSVQELADALDERGHEAAAEFRERHGDSPALQMVLGRLRKQTRRARRLLAQ